MLPRPRRPRPTAALSPLLAATLAAALAAAAAGAALAQPDGPGLDPGAALAQPDPDPAEVVVTAMPLHPGPPRAARAPQPPAFLDPAEAARLRRPGWSLDLRRWMTLSRIYTAAGLPPPLPGEGQGAGLGGHRAIGAGAAWRSAPEAAAPAALPAGLQTLLVLGTDRRGEERIWRTDTLLMVFFQAESGRVILLSIPRDLWVSIPGHGAGRINTVDYLGEAAGLPPGELLRRTLEANLGLAPEHQLRLDLEGFVRLVDALGGVDVAVDCPLEDFFFDPEGLGGEVPVSLEPGLRHMDGRLALRYARSRWGSSDFERARRQQRLLRGLLAQARQLSTLRRLPQVWQALSPYLRSDLSAADIGRLALQAAGRHQQLSLRSHVLQFPDLIDWMAPDGSQVLLLQPGAMPALLYRLLDEDPAGLAEAAAEEGQGDRSREIARPAVALRDATGRPGWSALLRARLADAGWPQAEARTQTPQATSLIYHQPQAAEAAAALARDLGLGPEALQPAAAWSGPPPKAALWLVAGADWQSCPHP